MSSSVQHLVLLLLLLRLPLLLAVVAAGVFLPVPILQVQGPALLPLVEIKAVVLVLWCTPDRNNRGVIVHVTYLPIYLLTYPDLRRQ